MDLITDVRELGNIHWRNSSDMYETQVNKNMCVGRNCKNIQFWIAELESVIVLWFIEANGTFRHFFEKTKKKFLNMVKASVCHEFQDRFTFSQGWDKKEQTYTCIYEQICVYRRSIAYCVVIFKGCYKRLTYSSNYACGDISKPSVRTLLNSKLQKGISQ